MKLPENQELKKWVEKNLGSDAANTVFNQDFSTRGDLGTDSDCLELEKRQLQCTMTLILITVFQHQRLQRQLAGYNLILWVLVGIGFIVGI